jgi:cobalt/nickel transport system permease protein
MHISEGVLTAPVLIGGGVITAAGTAMGLRKLDYDRIPEAGVISAAFFVASLIHVPAGPASVHLLLIGLGGVLLGWSVFPAMLVALFLQAVLFGFGGLTTLGVNTANYALPAIVCYYLFNRSIRRARSKKAVIATGAAAGVLGPVLAFGMVGTEMYIAGEEFIAAIHALFYMHIVIFVIEAFVTASAVSAVKKLEPELLGEAL